MKHFGLRDGQLIGHRYEVVTQLGAGWEGEVYLIRELATGIERTAKIFFPQRNPGNRTAKQYATKLHKLRHCPVLIQYVTQEKIQWQGAPVTVLVSEYVEGEVLSEMLKQRPGGRLPVFEALHLLYALAAGMAGIHSARDYHGDLHTDNIIVRRFGLGFEVKLIDMFVHPLPKRELIKEDICDLVRIFSDALGGARRYAKHPKEVKDIR